jgi:hypothetical protein
LAVGDMRLHIAVAIFTVLLSANGAQAGGPDLLCSGITTANTPAPGAPPKITIWHAGDLGQWQPPPCTGWSPNSRSNLIVSLTGSFRFEGGMGALLERVGAISALPSVMYWSVTDKKWGPLAHDASALNGPDPKSRRRDFAPTELVPGTSLYYWEDDIRSGEIVYRLKALESSPDRAVIASENITPVRRFLITLFKPGALQSVVFIQRLRPGVFGVYILNRTGEGTSALADGHEQSYVNRANALYRQLAGIKTDQEPPAAR